MTKNLDTLPPIVRDLIESIRKDTTPPHIRDVYAQRLENIVECGGETLFWYRTKHLKVPSNRKS